MLPFAVAMLVAIVGSAAGDFLMKKGSDGLRRVPLRHPESAAGAGRAGRVPLAFRPAILLQLARESGVTGNRPLCFGLLVLTCHFVAFLIAMRLAPVTVVIPLMSCTYVATVVLGRVALKERVSPRRWIGVLVIMAGVILVGISTL